MAKQRTPVFRNLLSYEVNRTSDLLRRIASVSLRREHGVSLMEWRTLARIEAMQPVMLRDLVEHSSTDKAQISRIVTGLVCVGWVERTAHATDARSATLALTAEGTAMARTLGRAARERDRALRSALTQKEAGQLIAILAKVRGKAERLVESEERE